MKCRLTLSNNYQSDVVGDERQQFADGIRFFILEQNHDGHMFFDSFHPHYYGPVPTI